MPNEPPTEPAVAPEAPTGLVPPRLRDAADPDVPPQLDAPGRVVLELRVEPDGHVSDATVLESTHVFLEEPARVAARALVFEPATDDGVPIPALIAFAFDFAPPPPPPPAPEPAPTPPAVADDEIASIDVEVHAERAPLEPTRHSLDAAEVRRVPGTNGDAIRAIESLPGVARPPGLDGSIIVRGSAPQDTQVFVDGALIPLAYHFGGVSSVVPSEILERLELRPGNFGSEYGRGMGGVVDLGIRSPRRDRLGGLVQVDVIDGRFLFEGPLGERTRFLVAGRRSWVDAWLGRVLESADTKVRTAPVYWDWQAIVEHDVTRRTTARLFLFGADDRLALTIDAPSPDEPSVSGDLSARSGFTRAQVRIDSRLTDDVRWTQSLTWGTEVFKLRFGDHFANGRIYSLQGRSEMRARLHSRVAIVGGVEVLWQRYDVDLKLTPYPAANEPPGPNFGRPARSITATPASTRSAAYATLELTPIDGLRLLPGLRVDHTQDTRDVTFDPRFAARWAIHEGDFGTTLKGAIGLYRQPPQPVESLPPFGTTGVNSTRSRHASLGIEQGLGPALRLSLEGFHKRFEDLVIAQASDRDTAVGVDFVNEGSGRAYGLEAMLRFPAGQSRFFGWISYTLSRSERREGDAPSHLFEFDQTHILSALGSVDLGRGWSVGGRWRYVTGSPSTFYAGGHVDLDAGAYAPVQDGEPFSRRLPAFHQLDLRIDKTWTFSAWRLTAYLDVRNAYNRQNPEGFTYRYDYAESETIPGLPILPVLGLRGEM